MYLMGFTSFDGGYGFRGESKWRCHQIEATHYPHKLSLLTLTLISWTRCVCQISSLKSYSFFSSHPLPILSFLGGSHYLGSPFQEAAHIQGIKESCPVSSRAEYSPKLFGSLLHRRFAYLPNVMNFYQYFYAGSFYFLQI